MQKGRGMPLRCGAQSFLNIKPTNVAVQQRANHMQDELAALQVQLSSANTNVDSLTSRLEDVQTDLAEKERLNNELQQEKAALKVQVGKRKLPDEKGGAEVEQLQKQHATLENQIKQLESRVTEEQNKASTHEKALQKERKNTEKLQLALEEQSVRTHIMIDTVSC